MQTSMSNCKRLVQPTRESIKIIQNILMLGRCSPCGRCCHHQKQGAHFSDTRTSNWHRSYCYADRLALTARGIKHWAGKGAEGSSPCRDPDHWACWRHTIDFRWGLGPSNELWHFEHCWTSMSHSREHAPFIFTRVLLTTLFRYCKSCPAPKIALSSVTLVCKCHKITDETLERCLFLSCINSLIFYSYLM